jgi:hypothetical protein
MYRIIGADHREYGPVSLEQLRQWLREGRVNAQTRVRYGEGAWQPLSSFPEVQAELAAMQPVPPGSPGPDPYAFRPQTNGMALAGVILSSVGLLCCCSTPLFSTLGLVFSAIGFSQINNDPARWTGRNLAIVGMVLAALGFLIFIVAVLSGQFTTVVERSRSW